MSLVVLNCPPSSSGSFIPRGGRSVGLPSSLSSSTKPRVHRTRGAVTAFLFDPNREPILKEALKRKHGKKRSAFDSCRGHGF